MTQNNNLKPALSPQLFWRVLVAGNLMSLAVVLFVFHRMADAAMAPGLGGWLLVAGVLTVVPSLLFHRYVARRRRRQVAENASDNTRQLTQFNQVIVACALAELPGLMGGVYYLFAREWGGTLALVGVTVILLVKARPR